MFNTADMNIKNGEQSEFSLEPVPNTGSGRYILLPLLADYIRYILWCEKIVPGNKKKGQNFLGWFRNLYSMMA